MRRHTLRGLVPGLLLAMLAFTSAVLPAGSARADAQVSVRPFLEFGKRFADRGDEGIVGFIGRSDAMFGAPKPRSFRLGPVLEARSVDFRSLELGAGAGFLIPFPGDCPIGISGLINAATRRRGADGLNAVGIVTWGFRGYNYHHWYGYAINAFGSIRKNITGGDIMEISGGIEIDILFTTIIPFMMVKDAISGEDPHED